MRLGQVEDGMSIPAWTDEKPDSRTNSMMGSRAFLISRI
jgi:hypothetical protein